MDATGLTQQMRDLEIKDNMIIENDVLFYLQKNHKGSTLEQIRVQCKNNFAEEEIFRAKQFLHDEYLTVLSGHDAKVGKALETPRRTGPLNNKIDTVIGDLMTAIDAIEACTANITITAKNEDRIPVHKSEAVQIKSILDRLGIAETDICQLKLKLESVSNENQELKSENQELKSENQELKAEVNKLATQLSGNNSDGQGAARITHVPPPGSGPTPSSPLLPPSGSGPSPSASTLPTNIDLASPPPPIIPPPSSAHTSDTPSSSLPTATTITDPPASPVPSSDPSAPAHSLGTPVDVSQVIASQTRPKKRLTNKQRKDIKSVREKSTLEATAEAVSNGIPYTDALALGKQIGIAKANTFAQVLKQANNADSTVSRPRIAPQGANSEYPLLPPPGAAASVANRSKLAKTAPYKRGKAPSTENNMVMQKPAFMNNKCLVISGLRKDASREECLEYIDKTANRKIDVLHIEILAREYSPWLTIAVELNPTDYELLTDINLWNKAIRIRDFIGWRFWHGKRPKKLAPHEIKGSVRMSWEKNSRTTL